MSCGARIYRHLCLSLSAGALLLATSGAWAADCSTMQGASKDDSLNFKTDDVKTCATTGWDPPLSVVPNPGNGQKGAAAGGSGGYVVPTVQAPQTPPKTAGAASSVSSALQSFNLSINLLFGGSSSSGSSSGSSAGSSTTPASSCPVRDDTTGLYGAVTDFCPTSTSTTTTTGSTAGCGAAFSKALSCGGTVPLTNYRITLVPNPTGLVVTEENTNFVWAYNASTGSYNLIGGGAMTFPKFLCEKYKKNGETHRRKTALPADVPSTGFTPQAQMIAYNSSTQSIAIRVMHDSGTVSAATPTEYYMILPIRNGVPYVPLDPSHGDNCDLQTDFYKPASAVNGSSLSSAMIIESTQDPSCEAEADVCAQVGASTTPTASTSCNVTTVIPSTTSCPNRQQYVVLDRPNLLFPPSTTMSAVPVQQRTAFMISTNGNNSSDAARLIGPSDFTVHLNQSNDVYVFSAGGNMALSNGQQLRMNGPATVDMNALVVTLPNGGEIDDSGGTAITTYPNNATMPISTSLLPVTVQSGGEIQMPSGFAILSEPSGMVREPMVVPQ